MNFFVDPSEGHDDYIVSAALAVRASQRRRAAHGIGAGACVREQAFHRGDAEGAEGAEGARAQQGRGATKLAVPPETAPSAPTPNDARAPGSKTRQTSGNPLPPWWEGQG